MNASSTSLREKTASKEETSYARRILQIATALALFGGFVLSWNLPGVQIPLLSGAIVLALLYLFRVTKRTISRYHMALLTFSLLVSMFTALRSSVPLTMLNVGLAGFLLSVVALEVSFKKLLKPVDYAISTWLLPLIAFPALDGLFRAARLKVTRKLTHTQTSILRGVLFGLPVLLLFGALFASADVVFASVFKDLFSFELSFSKELIGRAAFSFLIFALVASVLSYMFLKVKKTDIAESFAPDKSPERYGKYAIELSVVLGMLNALFLMFVGIQGVYLFGNSEYVLNGDITFAEYGRSGFFELLAVATLVFSLSYIIRHIFDLQRHTLAKILMLVLIAQVGLIVVSALRRLSLYEDAFGFTQLRFYSHSFIFFLIAAFGCLIYSVLKGTSEGPLLRTLLVSFAGFVIILNIVNPDAYIAQQNIDRYNNSSQSEDKIDIPYLYSLSDDAAKQKIAVFRAVEEPTQRMKAQLCSDKQRLEDEKNIWSVWNRSRNDAQKALGAIALNCPSSGIFIP